MAAETVVGRSAVQAVETSANRLLPGLSDEPAWPTLRGHLLLLAAAGADPVAELFIAAATRDLTSAHDQAAVIDSRIQDVNEATGPLPWLSGIPHRLAADPDWGPYLNARSQLVAQLADQVRRGPAAHPGAGPADRRRAGVARRHPDRPQRPATHPNSTTLPEFSNSDLISDSPLRISMQTWDGGNCSPEKALARPQTRSCPSWQKD